MAEDPTALNKVCDKIETIREKLAVKQRIIEKIQSLKAQCNGAPTFTVDASLPSLNINFAIFYFLRDIIAILGDLKLNELRARIVNWLVSVIEPLQKRIGDLIKSRLKSCYTCKVEPSIYPWLFLTDPTTNQDGIGWNVRAEDIDERCLLRIDPNSEYGKMKYDDGFNSFLWDVIQQSPATLPWVNPQNGRTIAHFTFLENSPISFVDGSVGNPQTTSPETNVFNVKIDDYYQNKTLTDFTIEYIDSILPLFDVQRLLGQSLDSTFNTISKELREKTGDECIKKQAEVDALLDQLIEFGIDEEEVIVDDSFFEFDDKSVVNIKENIKNKKSGKFAFTDCCNKKSAVISPQTLIDLNNQLSDPNINNGKKVEIIESSFDSIIRQSSNGVSAQDQDKAGFEVILKMIGNIMRDIWNLSNTPKNKWLNLFMEYVTNGDYPKSTVNLRSINEYYKLTNCVQKSLISEILKKLFWELLIPWILKNIRPIILCVIGKILKEKQENYVLSVNSLLGGNLLSPEAKEKINNALGKVKNAQGKVSEFSNNANLGFIKDKLGIEGEGLGKNC